MTRPFIILQGSTHFKTIHFRHHDITNDQIGHLFDGFFHAGFAVYSLLDVVLFGQTGPQVSADIGIVFNDQNMRQIRQTLHFLSLWTGS